MSQRTIDIKDAKNIMSVTGYTDVPISYKKSPFFYGYNVTCRVVKCKKLKLSDNRIQELDWLISYEKQLYGLK